MYFWEYGLLAILAFLWTDLFILCKRDHWMVEVGRYLWRSSGSMALFRQGHQKQFAEDHIRVASFSVKLENIEIIWNHLVCSLCLLWMFLVSVQIFLRGTGPANKLQLRLGQFCTNSLGQAPLRGARLCLLLRSHQLLSSPVIRTRFCPFSSTTVNPNCSSAW